MQYAVLVLPLSHYCQSHLGGDLSGFLRQRHTRTVAVWASLIMIAIIHAIILPFTIFVTERPNSECQLFFSVSCLQRIICCAWCRYWLLKCVIRFMVETLPIKKDPPQLPNFVQKTSQWSIHSIDDNCAWFVYIVDAFIYTFLYNCTYWISTGNCCEEYAPCVVYQSYARTLELSFILG